LLAASLGIEPRCPYTAPAYAHLAFNVPAPLKTRNGLVKYFFKKAIEGVLENEIIYRPKQGFRTPVVELFRGALGTWAEPILLDAGLTGAGLLQRDHLAETLRRHRAGERDYSNRLWAAMSLNLWHERWIGGAGDVPAAWLGPPPCGRGAGGWRRLWRWSCRRSHVRRGRRPSRRRSQAASRSG